MSKKSGKKGGSEAPRSKSDSLSADCLQAVLLIDLYNLYFSPISTQCPHALFPIANEPILCYTLHFLKNAGVQELFIVGKCLTKELEGLVNNFPLSQKGSRLSVHLLFSDGCDSVGTCLKHLHFSQQINSNFILLLGCVVSNMDLMGILDDHKARAKKNTGSMMTMVFQRGAPQQSSRTQESDLAVMVSKVEKQLLFYEKTAYKNKVKFPLQKILSHSSVKIHYDLQDTSLCICSPQVPQLFADNFDYQTLEDFINGVLVDEELLGNQIHTHILDDKSYLASASTPLLYHSINTDVMERWTYPYVPDTNLRFSPSDQYEYSRRNIYMGTCVTLERGSRLEENVVIGKQCHIRAGAFITRSVLGENVSVGENVKIADSYIWSNVTIQDECTITGCIIADSVVINGRCKISSGSFISRGLVIGPEVSLPPGTRLIGDFEDSNTNMDIGVDATATVSRQSTSHNKINIGSDNVGTNIMLIDSASKKQIVLTEETVWGASKPKIDIVIRPETPDIVATNVDQEECFYRELLEIIRYGIANQVSVSDIQMEIMSRRHAFAIPMEDISLYIVQVVVEGPTQSVNSAQELLTYVKKSVSHLVKIFQALAKEEEQQVNLLNTLETLSIDNHRAFLIFKHILYHLYEEEIVTQEAIFEWHSLEPSNDAQNKRKELRKSTDTIIEWLNTAEEESSSSD